MNNELVLRPATSLAAVRCRRGVSAALHGAWQLVLWVAPAINVYWTVGLPPYGNR